jgi:hypothetical protein
VVEAHEQEHALDEVVCRENDTEFHEFSQEHLGTQIFSSRELSATDYLKTFDNDNDYLKSWDIKDKMRFINTIQYKE